MLYNDAPSATEEALETFTPILDPSYVSKSVGLSGQLECLGCDCSLESTSDETSMCGENSGCINRLTSIECIGFDCGCGEGCENRRFQYHQYAKVDVIKTEKKGYGVRALEAIPKNTFIYEYTGEVIDEQRYNRRKILYERKNLQHFYFMQLQKDEFIDATMKGSIARFCNHSCNPNAYVDKWIVGVKLRMGIFAKRNIEIGEEITFNYNVDRYGAEAQPCYCGEANCIGFLGGKTQSNGLALPRTVVDALSLTEEEQEAWSAANADRRKEFDAEAASSLPIKEINEEDVSRIMGILMQCREDWLALKILARLHSTSDPEVHFQIIKMHGYQIFSTLLSQWKNNEDTVIIILEILQGWPKLTRNKIASSNIEPVVEKLVETSNDKIGKVGKELLDVWKSLEMAYRIPRRRSALPAASSASSTTHNEQGLALRDGNPKIDRITPDDTSSSTKKTGISFHKPDAVRPPRDPALEEKWLKERLEREKELQRQAAEALQRLREKQQDELKSIIAEAAAAAAASASSSTLTAEENNSEETQQAGNDRSGTSKMKTKKRSREEDAERKSKSIERKLTKLIGAYVPKIVWKYEEQLGEDTCRKHSRELTHLLVEKELSKGNDFEELSQEKRAKIRHYTIQYMDKLAAHRKSRKQKRHHLESPSSQEKKAKAKAYNEKSIGES